MRDFFSNVLWYFVDLMADIVIFAKWTLVIILLVSLLVAPALLALLHSPFWALLYIITVPVTQAIIDEIK